MQEAKMRRFGIILFCQLALAGAFATAGTFPLTDGTKIVGTAISMNDQGVVFQQSDGTDVPRVPWDKLSGDALKELLAEAKKDSDRERLEPLVESIPQDVAKRKEIVVKPIEPPKRPEHPGGMFALLGSPVGLMILLVLYAANLLAAFEVAVYRRQPLARVCGLAAIPFLGVLSPIIYGAMTSRPGAAEGAGAAGPAAEVAAGPEVAAGEVARAAAMEPVAEATPQPPAAVKLPEPIVFKRGEYLFNRRFFETKFAGFFRVVPSEAEKDLVLRITAARGQFTGRRISRITPNELYLQVAREEASAEEMIPMSEITEVQIRHKESL
jgi:hypothetical protein